MIFDPTITLGSLITAGGMLLGGLAFVWAMKSDIKVLAERISRIEGTIKDVTATMVQLARQEERMNALDRRMTDLAQGEGYVLPIQRSAREIGGG